MDLCHFSVECIRCYNCNSDVNSGCSTLNGEYDMHQVDCSNPGVKLFLRLLKALTSRMLTLNSSEPSARVEYSNNGVGRASNGEEEEISKCIKVEYRGKYSVNRN